MLVSVLSGCGIFGGGDDTSAEAPTEPVGTQPPQPDDSKIEHTITVKSAGGLKLSGVNVYIYTDDTLEDLVNYATTDGLGVAKINLKRSDKYVAVLSGLPEGYNVAASYPLTGSTTELTVTSSVIDSTDHSGKNYQLGDVMRDFSVVDTDGNTQKLSELLKTKKMVLINFWYTTCSWCVKEFPYMDAVYQQYKDDIDRKSVV